MNAKLAEAGILFFCTITFQTVVSAAQILGVIVAIGALVALIYQIRRSRFSLSVELALKLEDRFFSKDFEKRCSTAAQSILSGDFLPAEDVFDFFETVGHLVRRGAVDRKIIWNTFFHWTHGYWSAGVKYMLRKRKEENNKTLWEDFEYLHEELLKLERKGNSSCCSLLKKIEIKQFLKEESSHSSRRP